MSIPSIIPPNAQPVPLRAIVAPHPVPVAIVNAPVNQAALIATLAVQMYCQDVNRPDQNTEGPLYYAQLALDFVAAAEQVVSDYLQLQQQAAEGGPTQ